MQYKFISVLPLVSKAMMRLTPADK